MLRTMFLILIATALAACHGGPTAGAATAGADGMGVLTGRVTRGPTAAVARPGAADMVAAAGIEIRLRGRDGTPVSTVRTDARGIYEVSLPPGTYEVVIGLLAGIEFTKDLPATVAIVRDRITTLDVRIDTGIR
jgi:hypothetical protein